MLKRFSLAQKLGMAFTALVAILLIFGQISLYQFSTLKEKSKHLGDVSPVNKSVKGMQLAITSDQLIVMEMLAAKDSKEADHFWQAHNRNSDSFRAYFKILEHYAGSLEHDEHEDLSEQMEHLLRSVREQYDDLFLSKMSSIHDFTSRLFQIQLDWYAQMDRFDVVSNAIMEKSMVMESHIKKIAKTGQRGVDTKEFTWMDMSMEIRVSLAMQRVELEEALFIRPDDNVLDSYIQKYYEHHRAVGNWINALEKGGMTSEGYIVKVDNPAVISIIREIRQMHESLLEHSDRMFALQKERLAIFDESYMIDDELDTLGEAILDILKEMDDIALEELVHLQETIVKSETSGMYFITVTMFFAVVLAMILGWILNRHLLKQLGCEPSDIETLAKRVASGNLDGATEGIQGLPVGAYSSLEQMVIDLKNAKTELETYQKELESLVDARTLELKKAEQDALEAKTVAENATKAKADFLANMSHEIRTPMNAIIGMTALALDTGMNDKQKNYVQKANIAAENLLGIINDILDFSKIEAGKLHLSNTHFELKEIIIHTLHLISVTAKDKALKTRVKIDKDVPKYFFADALRLGQVLTNLGSNAVKFSHHEGSVTLGVSLVEESESDAVLQFSVEDDGIGISAENQKKLFKSFSQAESSTTRKFGGTGLGLAISKKITEMMDGTIWVESEEGMGSRFSFTVRMQKSDKASILKTTGDAKKMLEMAKEKLKGAKILLVEDNALNQELAEDLLTKNGLKVVIAGNGEEALKILEQEYFDGILMDCQMPVMDGYEATRKIRSQERYKDLPILSMTANVMSGDLDKALEAGMNANVAKPIVPHEMFTTMAQWIAAKNDA